MRVAVGDRINSHRLFEKNFLSVSDFSDLVSDQFANTATDSRTTGERVESVARYRRRTLCSNV
jgi:hypothetical protein